MIEALRVRAKGSIRSLLPWVTRASRAAALTALVVAADALVLPRRVMLTDPPTVPREFRAAWATPIYDMGMSDWPSSPGLSAETQRAELRAMLDGARDAGLNVVIFHVRLAADAMYPTPLAPWSAFL